MGEYAEMILDGVMCESCGCFLDNDLDFPNKCDDCHNEELKKSVEEDYPIEDMFGTEIMPGDSYFTDKEGRICLKRNTGRYLSAVAGAKYVKAKK